LTDLASYRFLTVPLSIGVIVPSIFVPWLSVNVLGYNTYSPADIFAATAGFGATQQADETGLLSTIYSYADMTVIMATMVMYVAALTGLLLSIPWKSRRIILSLVAGVLAMSSGVLWHYAIESLKSNFVQVVSLTGGIIGEEFRGQERVLADQFFVLGIGHYLATLAGAICIIGWALGMSSRSIQIEKRKSSAHRI
jgi:hypothetical protein